MVIVSKISIDSLLSIGFTTREQAMEAYKGIKSKPKESEIDYLKRTYDQVKDTIYKYKIDNLIKKEQEERENIEVAITFLSDFNKVKEQLKKTETQLEKINRELSSKKIDYEWLEIRYRNINDEKNKLQIENNNLRHANRDLYLTNTELLNQPSHRRIIIQTTELCSNKRDKILQLSTKRVRNVYECSICGESIYKKETVLDICHRFHIKCIMLWLFESNTCPCCRTNII